MPIKKLPKLEQKDRTYILTSEATPISYTLSSRNTKYKPLLYFDGVKNRPLRYSSNQTTCFADAQDDQVIIEPVIFENGKLIVKKENTVLQQFLSILHPELNKVYYEFNPEENAQDDVEDLITQHTAVSAVLDMDISSLEAIARVVNKGKGVSVDKLTSSELKRDMILEAKRDPEAFMLLANDTDIKLRNLAVRAIDSGILTLRDDNSNIYMGNTKNKILTIPFGDNPYTALSSYFKTDDGVELMISINKKFE